MAAEAAVAVGGKRRRCTRRDNDDDDDDDASPAAVGKDEKAPKVQKTSPEADLEDAKRLIERLKGWLGDLHYSRDDIDECIRRGGFCQMCYRALARCSCQTPTQQAESVVHHLGGLADATVRAGVVKLLTTMRSQFDDELLVSKYADAVTGKASKSHIAAMVFYDLRYELDDTAYENALQPDSPMRWLVALLSSAGLTFETEISESRALLSACDGRPRLARLMLSVSSESVDVKDDEENTPLLLAIAQPVVDVDLIQELVRRSSDAMLNMPSGENRAPLFEVIARVGRDEGGRVLQALHVLLAAANDDGSGVDLLSPDYSTELRPDEDAHRELITAHDPEEARRCYVAARAIDETKSRVLLYRTKLVAALYEALLRPPPKSDVKEGYFKGITGLAQLVGSYIALRFDELIATQRDQRQRPAAAAAAAAAACQLP